MHYAWYNLLRMVEEMDGILADILKLLKEVEDSTASPETTLAVMKARLWAIHEAYDE
jgi:hypothetical protein